MQHYYMAYKQNISSLWGNQNARQMGKGQNMLPLPHPK
jgi:hypothetical protein